MGIWELHALKLEKAKRRLNITKTTAGSLRKLEMFAE